MKVLIILNDLKNGGVERVLSVIANYLSQKDYDVHVLAIASDKRAYKLNNEVHYEYVPIIEMYKKVGIFKEFKTMWKIFKEIKRINPDVFIGFDDSIIIRSVPSAWLLRKRIIVSERIDPSIYGLPMRIVRQIAYDMADAVVFQTPDARDFFPERIRKKSVIIPNPLKENLPYHDEKPNNDIVMACRLMPQKNIHIAIKGFADFYSSHPEYRLVIYGDGSLKEDLIEYAKSLKVDKNVLFPGHTDIIHEKMKMAAMYLSSSDYEGISNSMIEALAIGVPTICTDCPVGGARMFITNNINGVLVPVNDSDKIAEAMGKIADNKQFAQSISSQSIKIRDKLSSDIICPKWEELINSDTKDEKKY